MGKAKVEIQKRCQWSHQSSANNHLFIQHIPNNLQHIWALGIKQQTKTRLPLSSWSLYFGQEH